MSLEPPRDFKKLKKNTIRKRCNNAQEHFLTTFCNGLVKPSVRCKNYVKKISCLNKTNTERKAKKTENRPKIEHQKNKRRERTFKGFSKRLSKRLAKELSKGLSKGLSKRLSKRLPKDFQKDFRKDFKRTFKKTFEKTFKRTFKRTDRQTDRQRERKRFKKKRKRETARERERERERDRQTDRPTDRQANRQVDRQIEAATDQETKAQKERADKSYIDLVLQKINFENISLRQKFKNIVPDKFRFCRFFPFPALFNALR